MRVAISGAQSTGKSTLLGALKDVYQVTFVEEITRDLKKKGYKINELGDDTTQVQIMKLHEEYSKLDGDIIYDRCALDGIVYTRYLYENGNISDIVYEDSLDIFVNIIDEYDIVFYLKPEFDIVNDGERSVDLAFRDRIVELFDEYINNYNLPVITLTGSVQERVQQFMKEVDASFSE